MGGGGPIGLVIVGVSLAAEAIAAKHEKSKERKRLQGLPSSLSSPCLSKQNSLSREASIAELPSDKDCPAELPADTPAYATNVAELEGDQPDESLDEDAPPPSYRSRRSSLASPIANNTDEKNWALDEAALQLEQNRSSSSSSRSLSNSRELNDSNKNNRQKKYGLDSQPTIPYFVSCVYDKCTPPPQRSRPLPFPVILPQRRPGSKDRGFIRAYAPILAEKGIPQEAFLSLIKNFQSASKASPLLNVVWISAAVAGLVPSLAAQITSTVVQVAVGAAIELQKRARTNSFLDEVNAKVFQPRGLYALVMAYKPEGARPVDVQQTDVISLLSKWSSQGNHSRRRNLRGNDGVTYGDLEMPEAAPLVFPQLDDVATAGEGEKASRLKRTGKFVADYYDRRAQAKYVSLTLHLFEST